MPERSWPRFRYTGESPNGNGAFEGCPTGAKGGRIHHLGLNLLSWRRSQSLERRSSLAWRAWGISLDCGIDTGRNVALMYVLRFLLAELISVTIQRYFSFETLIPRRSLAFFAGFLGLNGRRGCTHGERATVTRCAASAETRYSATDCRAGSVPLIFMP